MSSAKPGTSLDGLDVLFVLVLLVSVSLVDSRRAGTAVASDLWLNASVSLSTAND